MTSTHRARVSAGARTSRASFRCRSASALPPTSRREGSILPEDHVHRAPLIDQSEAPRPKTVRARHAASIIVLRTGGDDPEMLMGMRGAKHRFMPNRLVFPGGAVDRADLSAAAATPPPPHTQRHLRKVANEH